MRCCSAEKNGWPENTEVMIEAGDGSPQVKNLFHFLFISAVQKVGWLGGDSRILTFEIILLPPILLPILSLRLERIVGKLCFVQRSCTARDQDGARGSSG